MHKLHALFGAIMLLGTCCSLRADSPAEIYQRRVVPLLQSSKASSCSECHLQGLHLDDFLTTDPKASFASLRSRGWIDVDKPEKSKLLEFIAKKPERSNDLMEQVRKSELDAIREWIQASVRDPDSLNTPLPKLNDLKLDEELIRHSRKDHVLGRFIDSVWSQFERCANCHSPDRNAKQVAKSGEQMSWIVPNSPEETLQLLERRQLINIENPEASLLRTKGLGLDEHGGGIKFPGDGQTDREWSRFLEDYSAIKKDRYRKSSEIPNASKVRTWRTGYHLRVKDLPSLTLGQYAVVLFYPVDASGDIAKNAVAFAEGRVAKDGASWGSSLMILEPTELRGTHVAVEWSKLFPDAKYQLRWLVVNDAKTSIEEILAMNSTSVTEIDSLWKTGHSSAKSISFTSFHSIERSR